LEQASLGEFWNTHKFIRHGEVGTGIVREFDFSDTGIDKATVVDAVAKHDMVETNADNPYISLVRDADRLALFRSSVVSNFFANRANGNPAPISPLVREAFLAGRLVLNEDLSTLSDEILRMLAWITDMSYPATLTLIKDEHLTEGVEDQLRIVAGELNLEIKSRISELKT
jgi:hypothetical protein